MNDKIIIRCYQSKLDTVKFHTFVYRICTENEETPERPRLDSPTHSSNNLYYLYVYIYILKKELQSMIRRADWAGTLDRSRR